MFLAVPLPHRGLLVARPAMASVFVIVKAGRQQNHLAANFEYSTGPRIHSWKLHFVKGMNGNLQHWQWWCCPIQCIPCPHWLDLSSESSPYVKVPGQRERSMWIASLKPKSILKGGQKTPSESKTSPTATFASIFRS